MSKKQSKGKPLPRQKPRDSVFREAWDNMNHDMARVMPEPLAKRLQSRKGKLWVMVTITIVELVVLGVLGKFAYDWFAK